MGVRISAQILANLTDGLYLSADDLIDSYLRASEDLELQFGDPTALEEDASTHDSSVTHSARLRISEAKGGPSNYIEISLHRDHIKSLVEHLQTGLEFNIHVWDKKDEVIAALIEGLTLSLPVEGGES